MTKTLIFFLSTFLTSSLFAGSGRLAKDLESLDPASNVDVILQFQQASTEANHQGVLRLGAKLEHEFGAIKARHYSIPVTALANPTVAPAGDAATSPALVFTSSDQLVFAGTTSSDSATAVMTNGDVH